MEEESRRVQEDDSFGGSRYIVHAYALQASVEKVTVLRGAVKYTDLDFTLPTSEGASKLYKLALLYDKYFEYAEMLTAQGLVKEATEYLKLIPQAYTGSAFDSGAIRERLLIASGESSIRTAAIKDHVSRKVPVSASYTPAVTTARTEAPSQGGQYLPPQLSYQPARLSHQPEPLEYAPLVRPALLSQPGPSHPAMPPVTSAPPHVPRMVVGMTRQLSRLSVAYPTLLTFPNRQPSYLLSRMHHSRHLPLVLRSTQGKIMHRFLHYRAQRVYSVSLPQARVPPPPQSRQSPGPPPHQQLVVGASPYSSPPLDSRSTWSDKRAIHSSDPSTRSSPRRPTTASRPIRSCHATSWPHRAAIHSTPIWAICSSTQPRSTYRTFPASQDRIHRPNRRKGNPVLDLDLLSRLWIEHSQCEGHHPLIPTLHKNPLGRAQRCSTSTGGPPLPKYRE